MVPDGSLAPAGTAASLVVQPRRARPRRPSGAGESSVTFSGYHSLALVDVESRDGRAFVPIRGERRALRRILDDACAAAGAGRYDLHRSSRGEGFVLAFHAATAKADLTTRFVRA